MFYNIVHFIVQHQFKSQCRLMMLDGPGVQIMIITDSEARPGFHDDYDHFSACQDPTALGPGPPGRGPI